jgi:hypothetical protein
MKFYSIQEDLHAPVPAKRESSYIITWLRKVPLKGLFLRIRDRPNLPLSRPPAKGLLGVVYTYKQLGREPLKLNDY